MDKRIIRTRAISPFVQQPDDSLIICRCEEITKGEIRQAVHDGMVTMSEVKRYLRTGMGLCQGQTCSRLVRNIIAKELQAAVSEVDTMTPRNPVRSVAMKTYAHDGYEKGGQKP